MKKRYFFPVIIFLLLTFILVITNTAYLMLLELSFIFSISSIIYILIRLFLLFTINKYYNDLIKTVDDIENLKIHRYKTYFTCSDTEFEQKINFWDDCIETAYEYSKILIETLKDCSNYSSKKQLSNILVIEEKIRNTSRT